MNDAFRLTVITAPAVIFFIAGVLYHLWFRWWESIQGKSQMGLIAAVTIMFGLNAVVGFSYVLFGSVADWWAVVEVGAFVMIAISGFALWAALSASRQDNVTPVREEAVKDKEHDHGTK